MTALKKAQIRDKEPIYTAFFLMLAAFFIGLIHTIESAEKEKSFTNGPLS
jgi:hypothetical protein